MRPRPSADARIRKLTEAWFITEPLLFATILTHRLVARPGAGGIRTGEGRVEHDPAFIDALPDRTLAELLRLEAVRILLKHPYMRRPAKGEIAYLASNITLREHVPTTLPLPTAAEVFGDASLSKQYFELYCDRLLSRPELPSAADLTPQPPSPSSLGRGGLGAEPPFSSPSPEERGRGGRGVRSAGGGSSAEALAEYFDPSRGADATALWQEDSLVREQIDEAIRDAQSSDAWGTLPGSLVAQIVASLKPRLDYRRVLRAFRTSILSSRRELTRMKPSRRWGFLYMGSRHRLRTRLLVAVDVSGSIGDDDLDIAFSTINQLFQYGVETIDVVQFDTEIHGPVTTWRKRRPRVSVTGRGGTSFQDVLAYIDAHRDYDGLIILTDGIAAKPEAPKNRKTRVLWLFHHEDTWARMHAALRHVGPSAYIKVDPLRRAARR